MADSLSVVNDFQNNRPIYFKVILPIQDILPNVDFIFYNGRLICQGPQSGRSKDGIRSSYLVHRTVTIPAVNSNSRPVTNRPVPPNNNVNVIFEEPVKPIVRPTNPPVRATSRKPVSPTNPVTQVTQNSQVTKGNVNNQCGQSTVVAALVIGGQKFRRGQFPWIVAFYYQVRAGHSEFICGGTLVSSNLNYI